MTKLLQISDAHFGTEQAPVVRALLHLAVNLIHCDGRLSPRQCTVERWDYFAASGRFERHTSQVLSFDAN